MSARHTHDRFTSRVLSALAVVATMTAASLAYAVVNIQVVA